MKVFDNENAVVYREFQREAIDAGLDYLRDTKEKKYAFEVLPTAAGKSYVIAGIVSEWGEPTVVIQPSTTLLSQNLSKLRLLGGDAAVCCAGLGQKDIDDLTYGTIKTLKQFVDKLIEKGVRTVLVDECHEGFSPIPGSEFRTFLDMLKPKKMIGFTASPYRLKNSMDGSTLIMLNRMSPRVFSKMLIEIPIQKIVSEGFWSPLEYEEHEFDKSGLVMNSNFSDYTDASVKKALNAQGVNNNIYLRIKKLQQDPYFSSILVFVDSTETARVLASHPKMRNATYVDSSLKSEEVIARVDGFKNGEYEVMFVFGILVTGFDFPNLRALIVGRPTMSLAVYYQMIGRLTRLAKELGKEYGLVIDFCSNVRLFGRIEGIEIRDVEGYGLGVFSNDRLMTGQPLKMAALGEGDILKMKREKFMDKMPSGKYKGRPLEFIPRFYLEFIIQKNFCPAHLKEKVEKILAR